MNTARVSVKAVGSSERDIVEKKLLPGLSASLVTVAAIGIGRCAFSIGEDAFLQMLSGLERFGFGMAITEGLVTAAAIFGLVRNIRNEKRRSIWIAGIVFTAFALAANMLDYFGTLLVTPDLAMESSPIWNGIIKQTGLPIAIFFGFIGKLMVSVIAGASFVFYLRNVHYLMPKEQQSLLGFVSYMGEKSTSLRDRVMTFSTAFSFYFAAINLFCFYIAYSNSLVNDMTATLPPLPAAICIAVAIITAVFIVVTHALQKWIAH